MNQITGDMIIYWRASPDLQITGHFLWYFENEGKVKIMTTILTILIIGNWIKSKWLSGWKEAEKELILDGRPSRTSE
jgi:hypothetical protein